MEELNAADPARVGPFRLVGRLGSGRVGVVYLAEDAAGGRVAVKVIHSQWAGEPSFRTRFADHVEAASQVDGPGLARVVAADPQAPQPWLATEYVSGRTLEERVTTDGPLPTAEVEALAVELCAALSALHAAGVIHRDITPANIVLADAGPRLIDLGIAHALDATKITTIGPVFGTPAYLSPEQVDGRDIGPGSDIFSLAGVLTFARTGFGPFGLSTNPVAMLARVSAAKPDVWAVPKPLRGHLLSCLAREPADRPSAEQLAALIRESPCREIEPVGARPADATTPRTVQPVNAPVRRRNWRPWMTGTSVALPVVAAVVIGATLFVSNQADPVQTPLVAKPSPATTTSAPPPARKITLDGQQVLTVDGTSVTSGVFSPDSRTLATGSRGDDDAVRLWDTTTAQQIGPTFEGESAAAFSPDGKILATGGDRGKVTLRDARTGREVGQLDEHLGERSRVGAIAFSPDGRTVATRRQGSEVDVVGLWDVASRTMVRSWDDRTSQWNPRTVQFTPDGSALLISGDLAPAQLWDVATGQAVWTLQERGPATLSADGRRLAANGSEKAVKVVVYDTSTRTPVLELPKINATIAPDGTVLVGNDGLIWDVASGRQIAELPVRRYPLAFSRDMRTIAYGFAWQFTMAHVTVAGG